MVFMRSRLRCVDEFLNLKVDQLQIIVEDEFRRHIRNKPIVIKPGSNVSSSKCCAILCVDSSRQRFSCRFIGSLLEKGLGGAHRRAEGQLIEKRRLDALLRAPESELAGTCDKK